MGLDNIPGKLPCRTNGTAILNDDRQVICHKTQEAGGCPWQNANPPQEGRVLGIFGADCWYRGKYGQYLLGEAGIEGSFYGDNEDETYKSPESCLALADSIGESLADIRDDEVRIGLAYAEWYLRWAAENADGLDCWY